MIKNDSRISLTYAPYQKLLCHLVMNFLKQFFVGLLFTLQFKIAVIKNIRDIIIAISITLSKLIKVLPELSPKITRLSSV